MHTHTTAILKDYLGHNIRNVKTRTLLSF